VPTLRQRAAGEPGTDVATLTPSQIITRDLQRMEQQFQRAMPRGAEATQLIRDVQTLLSTNPKLAECVPATIYGGAMTMAQLGLRPGVLGHGWLVAFRDKKSGRMQAQLVLGYQGMVELAHRSGKIRSLIARTVFENDDYRVEYGLHEDLVHRPAPGDRGRPIAYYAVALFTTGGHAFITMTHAEMEAYRDRYAMARTRDGKIVGPWREQFEGMAHKTCVRQLAKWMPKGTDLAIGIAADESVRVDVDPLHSPETVSIAAGEDDTIDGETIEDNDLPPHDPATGEVQDPPPTPADWGPTAQPGSQP
jgi:recombination protein RecT